MVRQPVPPAQMPMWRGTRPLKRWRYVGAFSPELMLCAGDARVGFMRRRFWAIAEADRPIVTRSTLGGGGVQLDPGRVRVDAPGVRVELEVDEDGGRETVLPSGSRGYVWTRKQAGVPVRGEVRIDGRTVALDCFGVVDETAGYHERHTRWTWSAGVGTGGGGQRIGWNLVIGVNDPDRGSERAIWIDGEAFEPGPVRFAGDLSRVEFTEGGALEFREWSAREERTNFLLVRSRYRQPFGEFSGELPGGVSLKAGFGVMEWHDVHW
jgi:hypothetical protein